MPPALSPHRRALTAAAEHPGLAGLALPPGIMDHVKRNSTGSAADAAGGDGTAGKAATGRLLIWPSERGAWLSCPADEITWLDRSLLSGNEDLTLHRPPRCAGLRYVHHQWELFSRDTTHEVFLAPHGDETPLDHRAVQATARHVSPADGGGETRL